MEWTVEDHLRGKPEASVALYRAFVARVEACGPVTFSVSKTTITLKGTRRGFAGARPTAAGVRGYLDLQRVAEDPRFTSAAEYGSKLVVHHFTLTDAAQLDGTFDGFLAEAYAVGAGAHLDGPTRRSAPRS